MPNCVVGYFLDVVQIVGEVLQMFSNLIIGVYFMIVFYIERRGYLGNLGGKVLVIVDLLMVVMEVIMFLVGMILLCLRKYLLIHLLNWVLLLNNIVSFNMVVVRWCWGGGGMVKRIFTNLFGYWC